MRAAKIYIARPRCSVRISVSGLLVRVWFHVRSVSLSVAYGRVLCKNSRLDRDAVWVVGLVRPRKHVLDGGPDRPREVADFEGE